MNIDTGELKIFPPDIPMPDNYIPIDPKDMTRKQRREMKVSLYDHKSVLGKKLRKAKKEVKMSRRDRKRFNSGVE